VTQIRLAAFAPAIMPALAAFLNGVLSGHRHWVPITQRDFAARVLDQPAFDPRGLILAVSDGEVVGGIHAIKPVPLQPAYQGVEPQHHIAWLAVAPNFRGRGLGDQLLSAAEDYLYYCPTYFAGQTVPFYGILESLWAPWYGSTERMGISALNDRDFIAWMGARNYHIVNAGDVSLLATLQDRSSLQDPGLAKCSLSLVSIDEQSPWMGDEPTYRLRNWGRNGGRPYQGLVVADGDRAVGSVVWYPLPAANTQTAALAWLGLERHYRGLRFGSYLLDVALAEMAGRGYRSVEVHVHTKISPEAYGMFRNRGFEVIDYWVNLVKT
jgi:ribosomal protein S18 acetylase RimI-like enzyme